MKLPIKHIFYLIIFLIIFQQNIHASQDKTEDLNLDSVFNMSMKEMLQVVVTTAGKKEEKIADTPASVVIISRKDIERFGFSSLEEILDNVPGMFKINDMSGYKPIFGVRGFWEGTPKNIIFLINGVTQMDGCFELFPLAQFNLPVESIDRIEIIRGPMSVMYGPGAFFGAINIITNDTGHNQFHSLYSASYGSRETRKLSVRTTGTEGDLSFSLNGGYAATNGLNEPLSKMATQAHLDKLPSFVNYQDSTNDQLESKNKHFNLHIDYQKFHADVSFNKSRDEIYVVYPSFSFGTAYIRQLAKIHVGYKESFSDFIKLASRFTYHQFNGKVAFDWWNPTESGYTDTLSEMFEAELISYMNFNPNLSVTSGLYLKKIGGNLMNGHIHNANQYLKHSALDDIHLISFYSQADYHFLKNFRLIAGCRVEQLQKYDILITSNPGKETEKNVPGTYDADTIDFIPRLAAIYSMNDNNVFKLLYGEAISRPSFFQNVDQAAALRPNLKSEKIQTVELNYLSNYFSKVSINMSIFYNILDHLIVRFYKLTPEQRLETYSTNAGKMITRGCELTLKAYPMKDLFFELSGTYQHTTDERDGFENINVEYSPHFLGYFKAAYQHNDNIVFSLTSHYIDKMDTHWMYDHRLGEEVDGYLLVDANLRINDIAGKGWYFNLHAKNLFDEDYLYPTYTSNSNWVDKGTTGDPFSVIFTLGLKL